MAPSLAAALACWPLACWQSTPAAAFDASYRDLVELDLTGFTGCFDYAVLAGQSFPFACGQKTSKVMDEGNTGKTMSLSGKWRVTCADGIDRYSAPYTYNVTLAGEGNTTSSQLGARSPCPEKPYSYFTANVYQHTTKYGGGYHFTISVTNTWWQQQ